MTIKRYQLDNLYLDKQYLSAIDFALSHFRPPLTTEAILQGKKKKKWGGGGEVGGEGGGVWGGVGRRLAEVYDILVWCYFNLGDWKMMQQILLALVLTPLSLSIPSLPPLPSLNNNEQVGSTSTKQFCILEATGKGTI